MGEVKLGYKLTEVGVIPEDWKSEPLAKLAIILHGFGFRSQYFKPLGKYRLTTPGHFYETGGFRDVGEKQKFYDGPFSEEYLLSEGDLIVAMTEQADGLLGSAALIPIDGVYLHNQRLGKVKVLSSEVSIKFLYRIFNSKLYRARVRETAAGTKVKHTSPSKLLDISVPLPPTLAEQEAIAAALSDADALIEALEQLIAKKRQVKQGAMQELLTGKRRLPGFSGEWAEWGIEDMEKLGLLKLGRGKVISKIDIENVPGVYPIYSSSVIANGLFGCYGKYMFDEELITWSIDGGGHFFYRPQHRFSVTNVCGYMRAATKEINCAFIAAQLQLLHSRKRFDYQTKAHPSVIRKAYTLRLPSYREQTAIAAILSDMDAEIDALEEKLAKARQVKQGMMQELLTGRIRLL